VEDLQRKVASYTVQVEPLTDSGVSESLRLRNVKFTPEFVRGSAEDGEHVVPLRDVASLRWRSWRGGAAAGLLVGPFVGGALGVAIGFSLPHSCGPGCNDSEAQSLNGIGGLILGGVVGFFLGPLVGAFIGGDPHVDFAEATSPRADVGSRRLHSHSDPLPRPAAHLRDRALAPRRRSTFLY
jgi:hypothetical protein